MIRSNNFLKPTDLYSLVTFQKPLNKKIVSFFFVVILQIILLYLFFLKMDLIFNFKISYITKVYVPSYSRELKDFINSKDKVENPLGDKPVPVLLYHGVVDGEEKNVSIDEFREQMNALKDAGYQTVSMEEFYRFQKGEIKLPEKSFLLTFDDGRKDSLYPTDAILRSLDYNAVMFVISKEALEKNDRESFHLSKRELKRMIKTGRWEIQSHGKDDHEQYKIDSAGNTGNFLSNKLWLEEENRQETGSEFKKRIREDMEKSKSDLEEYLGTKITGFAYPFGDFGQTTTNFSKAKDINLEIVNSVYPLSFYQYGTDVDVQRYHDESFMITRIDIDEEKDDLIELLDKWGKSLP